jgi:hypothetical protein
MAIRGVACCPLEDTIATRNLRATLQDTPIRLLDDVRATADM